MSGSRERRQKHTSSGVLYSVFYTMTTDNRDIVTGAELCLCYPFGCSVCGPEADQCRVVNVPAGELPFTTALKIAPRENKHFPVCSSRTLEAIRLCTFYKQKKKIKSYPDLPGINQQWPFKNF